MRHADNPPDPWLARSFTPTKGKSRFTFTRRRVTPSASSGFAELFDLEEAWANGMTPRLRREIRQIVFHHFDEIVEEWNRHFQDRGHANN